MTNEDELRFAYRAMWLVLYRAPSTMGRYVRVGEMESGGVTAVIIGSDGVERVYRVQLTEVAI